MGRWVRAVRAARQAGALQCGAGIPACASPLADAAFTEIAQAGMPAPHYLRVLVAHLTAPLNATLARIPLPAQLKAMPSLGGDFLLINEL